MLTTLKFEVITHPLYSLDLRPCDYEVIGLLNIFLEGKHFSTDKEIKKVIMELMLQVGMEFWGGIMYKLPDCIYRNSDDVEHR